MIRIVQDRSTQAELHEAQCLLPTLHANVYCTDLP